MKSIKLTTQALILIAITPLTAFANALQKKESLTIQLQIQKQKLNEEIAVNTVLAEQLATDIEFIEDYSSGDLSLSAILAESRNGSSGPRPDHRRRPLHD
jgi:hypothetical protein